MSSDAMMPIGTSRCGFFASSACVETESNPMYAKKMRAAPAIMPSGFPPCRLLARDLETEEADARPAVRGERLPVGRVDVERADEDHEQHRGDLDGHHEGVEPARLSLMPLTRMAVTSRTTISTAGRLMMPMS